MRDKVELTPTVYRPPRQTRKFPIIMTMTSYVCDRYHDVGAHFVQYGYAFAIVHSRGAEIQEEHSIGGSKRRRDGVLVG